MEDFWGICMIHSVELLPERKSQVCPLPTSTKRIPDINQRLKVPDNGLRAWGGGGGVTRQTE